MLTVSIIKNLQRTKFSKAFFSGEEECIICWNQYNEQDNVTKLQCNDKHFFHTSCIESWIKSGNNSCPMCREPINRDI